MLGLLLEPVQVLVCCNVISKSWCVVAEQRGVMCHCWVYSTVQQRCQGLVVLVMYFVTNPTNQVFARSYLGCPGRMSHMICVKMNDTRE
jgi:hypothetical protein